MSYRQRESSHQSQSSLSEDSDYGSIYISEPVGRLRTTKSASESKSSVEKKVRCRGCLAKKSSKKNLVRHVKRNHKTIYAESKKKKTRDFVAREGQTIPDDPDYQIPSGQRQSPSDFGPSC